jgi:hypothetical protein
MVDVVKEIKVDRFGFVLLSLLFSCFYARIYCEYVITKFIIFFCQTAASLFLIRHVLVYQ